MTDLSRSHRLVVFRGTHERWDPVSNAVDTEFTYTYLLDGRECGEKQLDGATRVHFLRSLFNIANRIAGASLSERAKILEEIGALGQSLYRLLIPDRLRRDLFESVPECSLTIDTSDHEIPWELLHDGRSFVALRYALGRDVPAAGNVSSGQRKHSINVCLIGDPTEDLPQAAAEARELHELLQQVLAEIQARYSLPFSIRSISGREASKEAVLFDVLLSSTTTWDIVHFAGHGVFDATRPESSGLLLADATLKAFELETMKVRPVFFANACDAGVLTRGQVGYGLLKGLAPSFVRAGGIGYVGPLWPVSDQTAKHLALTFYRAIIGGAGLGEALLRAKVECAERFPDDPSWIGYVLYGHPENRLGLFEPRLTVGPYINDAGFQRVFQLEREYSRLELLVVNDLPWILWRPGDFVRWVDRIAVSPERRTKMLQMLYEYAEYFRSLITSGQKMFKGVVNLKSFRQYVRRQQPAALAEMLDDFVRLSAVDNFCQLFYDGDDDEIEELEIVSKNLDVYQDLSQSVYVFNKQTRFETNFVTYTLFADYNHALIGEYAKRFDRYYELCVKQYAERVGSGEGAASLDAFGALNRVSASIILDEIRSVT